MMRRILFLFALCALVSGVSAAGLTNRAIWSWSETAGAKSWTNSVLSVTNLYRFHLITPGFDPSNRYPLPGETVHIPVTIQNVGGVPITSYDFLAGFLGSWVSNWSVTVDAGTPKVYEPGDDTPFTPGPLAPGDAVYLWLNITIMTGLSPGSYSYVLTNSSADYPYADIITNALGIFLQNVTVASAFDGGHVVRNFDGTGFLGNRDVFIDVRIDTPPGEAWIYYDVDADPTGDMPAGTNNRRVPLAWTGTVWRGRIPASDPEIVEGGQVRFIVVVDGRVFEHESGGPFLYGVRYYAERQPEQEGPLLLTSNAGDFTVVPVRVLYTLPSAGHVNVTVYNLRGEIVRLLRNGQLSAGEHAEAWDGLNNAGREVSQGLYFISVHAPGIKAVRKVLFVKR